MSFSRTQRYGAIGVAVAVLLAVAVIFVPDMIARRVALNYLHDAGVSASVADVDVNLFTGTVTLRDAHGERDAGGGFDIAKLTLNLEYLPLFSRQLMFSRIAIQDARIDIRRTADNGVRVGGVPLGAGKQKKGGANWGFGVARLRLDALELVYSQPGNGSFEPLTRVVRINASSADDARTWQPDKPVPIDADFTVDDSPVRIKGTVTPFGSGFAGSINLETRGFPLEVAAPLTTVTGLKRLAGRIDSDLQIEAVYRADSGLDATLDGTTRWHDSRLTLATGSKLRSKRYDWDGTLELALLKPDGKPARITRDGTIKVAAFELLQPDGLVLREASAQWDGPMELVLGKDNTHFSGDGELMAGKTHLEMPASQIVFDSDSLDFKGQIDVSPGGAIAHRLQGQLGGRSARLQFNSIPLAIAAGDIRFDGRYQQQPGENDSALVLGVETAVDSAELRVSDPKLGTYWVAAASAHAEKWSVDGVDRIAIDQIIADRLRVFEKQGGGDPGAVVAAANAQANNFSLHGLAAYRVRDLTLSDADITLERDDDGLRVMSRFFTADAQSAGDKSASEQTASGGNRPATKMRVDSLTVDGDSTLAWHDYSVTPDASMNFPGLALVVNDFNTAEPDVPAHYRLSSTVGENGQLDSTGRIAAFAAGGADMALQASMHSLNLVPLSGYVNSALGRAVASGRMDAELDLGANSGNLDGTIEVSLFEFRLAGDRDERNKAELGVPLDVAIGMVRSDDGTIDLSTDILGDVTSPQFSIDNLVRQAILKGLRGAVTSLIPGAN